MCIQCHGTEDLWDANTRHLFVPAERLAGDIHWQKGLRCQDCHGGDATTTDLRSAHAAEVGFRKVNAPAEMPAFCGHCHSDVAYDAEVSARSQNRHGRTVLEWDARQASEGLVRTATSRHCTRPPLPAPPPISLRRRTRLLLSETAPETGAEPATDDAVPTDETPGDRSAVRGRPTAG